MLPAGSVLGKNARPVIPVRRHCDTSGLRHDRDLREWRPTHAGYSLACQLDEEHIPLVLKDPHPVRARHPVDVAVAQIQPEQVRIRRLVQRGAVAARTGAWPLSKRASWTSRSSRDASMSPIEDSPAIDSRSP